MISNNILNFRIRDLALFNKYNTKKDFCTMKRKSKNCLCPVGLEGWALTKRTFIKLIYKILNDSIAYNNSIGIYQ